MASLIFILLLSAGGICGASTPQNHYLLSCGAPSTVDGTDSTYDRRIWQSDNTFSTNFSSTFTASSTNNFNIPQIPFSTARIFKSDFTYSFPVSPGPKFIRLFFNPSTYSSSNSISISPADPYINVQANSHHLLLRNFSAYLSFNSSEYKEFYVYVSGSVLQLTFSPTLPSSYAFVNGIEVVSVPEDLYVGPTAPKYVAQPENQFDLVTATALETAYRLNVGGTEVASKEDSGNMYRQWLNDKPFFSGKFYATGLDNDQTTIKYTKTTPNYSAPADVYQTFRMMGPKDLSNEERMKMSVTWEFEVDLGFMYLVRLHWCEVVTYMSYGGFRIFDVYIDNLMAEEGVDVFGWVGADTAVYRDYVVYMDGGNGKESRGVLQLAMHPNIKQHPRYYDILLNGLEIFKLSRPDGSLNAPNPNHPLVTTPDEQRPSTPHKSPSHIVPAIIGAISGAILIAVLLYYLFIVRQRKCSKVSSGLGSNTHKSKNLFTSYKSGSATSTGGGGSTLPSALCRRFTLADIKLATLDFSDSLIIGSGGFGNVYRGTVNGEAGPTVVAIKRLNVLSKQGAREFMTEIEMLSKLRHVHLVSLVGYCDEAREMILVYEYMARGTLRDHIFPSNTDPNQQFSWRQRLDICVGAARGLHYLHSGADRTIIHRDVKSTNILLDDKWLAKVSDFGLSRLGPMGGDFSHVSTAVKGSFGYVDPEYYRRQQLTEKSDVYSFGVVLFEVLCGRAAVNLTLPKDQVSLAVWARRNLLSGRLDTIVDPNLKMEIAPECLRKFGDIVESCTRDQGANRPSMADVVWGLEFALELQKAAETTGGVALSETKSIPAATLDISEDSSAIDVAFTTSDSARLFRTPKSDSTLGNTSNSSGLFGGSSESYGKSNEVFSQIFKPEGR